MSHPISPKYLMNLIKKVHQAIWEEYKTYKEVKFYLEKWQEADNYGNWVNFGIFYTDDNKLDVSQTLHYVPRETLVKIAIDLGVDTPDFIPSIPTFKNELKSDYTTAYDAFTKATHQVESDPSLAIGLANSALESIIKEILKDGRIKEKTTGKETLYKLVIIILRVFNSDSTEHPDEIKNIGNSLANIAQNIEKLRSDKTHFHGKTATDALITDSIYAYFVVNSAATIGHYLNSYYKHNYPKPRVEFNPDDLPF